MIEEEIINNFEHEFAFLSNFYDSPIVHEGIRYPTVEHYYQAMKTEDLQVRKRISRLPHPAMAKKFGRTVELRKDWENVKLDVMRDGLLLKFSTHENLRKLLLETGVAKLVEGNTWGDIYWGVCRGRGQNHLGRLLMQVRTVLREAEQ